MCQPAWGPTQPTYHNPCFSAVLKKACIPNSALWPEASRRATPTCRGPLPQHGAACQHRGLTALMVLVLKSVAWPSGGRCQRRHHTTPVFCWQTFAISKSQEYTRSYKIDKIWQPLLCLVGAWKVLNCQRQDSGTILAVRLHQVKAVQTHTVTCLQCSPDLPNFMIYHILSLDRKVFLKAMLTDFQCFLLDQQTRVKLKHQLLFSTIKHCPSINLGSVQWEDSQAEQRLVSIQHCAIAEVTEGLTRSFLRMALFWWNFPKLKMIWLIHSCSFKTWGLYSALI